jgi:hypothetical protein
MFSKLKRAQKCLDLIFTLYREPESQDEIGGREVEIETRDFCRNRDIENEQKNGNQDFIRDQ